MVETFHNNVFGCFIWDLQETLLSVSFETCLKRRGDVLMGRHCYVLLRRGYDVPIRRRGDLPLRRLGDVPSRRLGCFIWDVRRWDVQTHVVMT